MSNSNGRITHDEPKLGPTITPPQPDLLNERETGKIFQVQGAHDVGIDGIVSSGSMENPSSGSDQQSDLPLRQVNRAPVDTGVQTRSQEDIVTMDTAKIETTTDPLALSPEDEKAKPDLVVITQADPEKEALKNEDAETEEAKIMEKPASEAPEDDGTGSEIQSIMEQFDEGMGGAGEEEIMSPRLEIAGPMLGSPVVHPPRRSSLEPPRSSTHSLLQTTSNSSQTSNAPPPRSSSLVSPTLSGLGIIDPHEKELPKTPGSPFSSRQNAALPPRPDPQSDLPFDFHRFLEQLRHRSADPVAKFLRSFLTEFGKKQWMVHEQVKIVSDFLDFITKKMAQSEIWATVSDAEFDNACEGMEKLVMNRLYAQTFSPVIPAPEPIPGRMKRRSAAPATGRRGQHQEDIERDDVLAQKVRIYSWVKEEHLDIKSVSDKGRKFLSLAQQG